MNVINKPKTSDITTGPLPASRKVFVAGTMHPDIRVPMRDIDQPGDEEPASGTVRLGSTCRVCPRQRCIARREPSVLRQDF